MYGENNRSESSKQDLIVEKNILKSSSHDCYVAVRYLSNNKLFSIILDVQYLQTFKLNEKDFSTTHLNVTSNVYFCPTFEGGG